MRGKVSPIPDGYHTVNMYISVDDAARAIEFYKEAFGALEKSRYEMPDGRILFAELQIGDSTLQVANEFPEHATGVASPTTLNATSCIIHLYVRDTDAVFASALKAGATLKTAVENTFWGDRYGQLIDPFGHIWSIATRQEEVMPSLVNERLKQFINAR